MTQCPHSKYTNTSEMWIDRTSSFVQIARVYIYVHVSFSSKDSQNLEVKQLENRIPVSSICVPVRLLNHVLNYFNFPQWHAAITVIGHRLS